MKINNLDDFITSPDMSGYESPITAIATQLQMMYDEEVMKAIQRVDIEVNKEELIKALNYNREQYVKGYQNGYAKGMEVAQSIIDKFVGYLDEDMIYRIKLAIDKKLNNQ